MAASDEQDSRPPLSDFRPAKPSLSTSMTQNSYSSRYSSRSLNYAFETVDARDALFSSAMLQTAATQSVVVSPVSPRVDLSKNMPPVLDQGDLGSCVSNAVANCLRFCLRKHNLPDFLPSRLFVYYHGRLLAHLPEDRDSGIQIRDAGKAVKRFHVCDEQFWPYDVGKFAEKPSSVAYDNARLHKRLVYMRVLQDLHSIKVALSDGYPMQIGFMVYDSFFTRSVDETGQVPLPDAETEKVRGGHSVVVVGYDDDLRIFIFQNSWGEQWGKKGYGTFPYDYLLNSLLAADFWTFRMFA